MRKQDNVITDEELAAIYRNDLDAFTCKSFNVLEPATEFQYNWHIGCIAEHLKAVWDGEIQNLIINMPPRSLKTITTSISFPAWAMGINPSIRFMLTSFKSSLAEKMTRKTRHLMKSDWYKTVFSETEISRELDRQYYFETTKRGQYFSSSMSSVTGEGCDIQICDDPINPDEALSDVVRHSVIETIRGTLFSRFNDPRKGRFILNMQRLHDDDPTGNLLQDDGWYHLKLPAEAIDKSHSITFGSKTWTIEQGDMLFPERFTREVLDGFRQRLGDYNYAGQFLQEPVPIGGGEIKPHWMQYYNKPNVSGMSIYILVDPSGGEAMNKKKEKISDWSAFVVVGLGGDNNFYVLDIIRDRLNPTERVDTLFMLHRKWNEKTGMPPKVGYERYGMQGDIHYIKEKQDKETYHFMLEELGGQMKKEDRIRRLIPDMQHNRWYFPASFVYIDNEGRRFDLIKELKDVEIKTFPRAKYDDMLDAMARIYDMELIFPQMRSNISWGAASSDTQDWLDF